MPKRFNNRKHKVVKKGLTRGQIIGIAVTVFIALTMVLSLVASAFNTAGGHAGI